MNAATVRLFIQRRFIPVDGSRRAIADGHGERLARADDRLAADLADALAAAPVADAGHRIRLDRRQGGRPCS